MSESVDVLTISVSEANRQMFDLLRHVRAGGAVRVYDNVRQRVTAWIVPPGTSPADFDPGDLELMAEVSRSRRAALIVSAQRARRRERVSA